MDVWLVQEYDEEEADWVNEALFHTRKEAYEFVGNSLLKPAHIRVVIREIDPDDL
jgi:hypothetical protein